MPIEPASSIDWSPPPCCPSCGTGITAQGRGMPFAVDASGRAYCRDCGLSVEPGYPAALREYEVMTAREMAARWTTGGGFDEAALSDPALRRELYVVTSESPRPYHGLLRAMLGIEAAYRAADGDSDGYEHFENLYLCGLLLFEIGDVTDAPALWAAKETDFDTHCGFDVQMLAGAGVDETIEHLRQRGGGDDIKAADYLAQCQAAGEFDDLVSWRESARAYHLGS